jgi:hypothetical protein
MTIEIVRTPWPRVLRTIMRTENTPPAHYLFIKAWCEVFGVSEWSMRLPSALAGVACVWFIYHLSAHLIGKNEALLSAALMAVSGYQVWYSQEARTYVFMVMLALWSCDEFVRMLDQPPKWSRELRYWIATVLLLYSHLYGVFAIAAQFVYYIFRQILGPKPIIPWGKWLQLQLAVWIPFAMWMPVLMQWARVRAGGFEIESASAQDITESYWRYIAFDNRWSILLVVTFVVLGAARRESRRALPLILSLLLLPVVIPVVGSILSYPLYYPRYGMIAMIGLFILAACGIARLPKITQPLVIALLAIPMLRAPDPTIKGPFRAVGEYLRQWMQPGEYVEVNTRANVAPVRYYIDRDDVKYRSFWGVAIPLGLPLPRPDLHIWFVVASPRPAQSGVLTIQRGHWRVVSQKKFDDVCVFELADGVTSTDEALPDEIRFAAKPPSKDRTPSATRPTD